MDRTVNHLASYGRHGDDTLLHVSRRELEGIRQLTGKGFTTNPHTGLPEAFNWAKVILPAIAGIAATALTGGAAAPFVGAAASGLTSFGVGKAQGESTSQALGEGIIGGLTSYAGGQLLNGVGAVADAVPTAASTLGNTAMPPIDPSQMASTALNQPTPNSLAALDPNASGAAANSSFNQLYGNTQMSSPDMSQMASSSLGQSTPTSMPEAGAAAGNPATPSNPASGIGGRLSNLGDRITNAVSNPGESLSQIGRNIQDKPMSALMVGANLYSSMNSNGTPRTPAQTPYDPAAHPPKFPDQQPRWIPDPAGYAPGVSPERRYFAKGGIASMRGEEGMTANVVHEAKAALLNEHPRPREALARFESMFGSDALSLMRDRLTGGRVRGAGGGMDDLIPGDIEGRQRVRLADGEFVIPADVVSGLGDGSTDHGVRRLHEMMNSVRKQRTGKEAQPKSIGGKITL
jgi:hypothetical protein